MSRTFLFAAFALTFVAGLFAPQAMAQGLAADAEIVETRTEPPKIKAAADYAVKDGVIDIEISEYAGYAGLIVANGGLEPSEDSIFFKKGGFKVRLKISEEESWSALNSGRIAAAPTTVDVLAVYGRQLDIAVPILIGFSRGADGVVVDKSIKRINELGGKIIASCQFTESDFFIRYLAQEAGLGVNMLTDLSAKADPKKVNLIYTADGLGSGDLFLRDLKAARKRLAGCITWEPKVSEVAKGSDGKAQVLVSNRNLLIIADILMLNRGFAKANPKIVAALVEGMLQGNNMVRTEPDKNQAVVGKAFKWDAEKTKDELAKVHLANLPENLAFFAGNIDAAGSYNYIYETAGYVYGPDLLGKQVDSEKLLDLSHLKAIEKAGTFKDQKASIEPLRTKAASAEKTVDDPVSLLSKDIRFTFAPNKSNLETTNKDNAKGLESIAQLLKVAPGSRVLLRGHADGSLVAKSIKDGADAKSVRDAKLSLKNLSKARCAEVKNILNEKFGLDSSRIDTQGVGADEPTGNGPDADRRVEVQWFTVE